MLLLRELREAGADDAAATLLARDPDIQATLENARATALLVEELRELEAELPEEQRAAVAGLLATGTELLQILREVGADDATATQLAQHPAISARPGNGGLTALLDELSAAGYGDTAQLAQGLAVHFSLENPGGVAWLLHALREAGADDAITALLARKPATRAKLDDPEGVILLLRELREAGADAAATLAIRAATHTRLAYSGYVVRLLEELRAAGAGDAAATLAVRAANAGMFQVFLDAGLGEAPSCRFGREPDGTPSQPWSWQEPIIKTAFR
jgi:hypothetical protein